MKRFYAAAEAVQADDGWHVLLDGRPVRTPQGVQLSLPTSGLANAVAAEWAACAETIVPSALPLTQLSNTALDRVATTRPDVVSAIAAYVDTDLICYRAERPESLVAAQSKAWDPWLAWAAMDCSMPLTATTALIGHKQPAAACTAVRSLLDEQDAFALTALHQLTVLCGSVVLALAFAKRAADAQTVWAAATVDERYNMDRWGQDEEAVDALEKKHAEFLAAATFWTNLNIDL
ncbi:MAG: ATP12 family protein [Pseudomonadota bacterium]